MYQTYFGLKEHAFTIAVDPRYLYMSRQHQEALAHLLYGVQGGGFVLLSGEVGTGKTTIIKRLLEQLPENTDIAIILNPMSNVVELLTTICEEFQLSYIGDEQGVKTLTDTLHHFLLTNHSQGRNTVLLVDEAQLLAPEVLEQLRLLTNLETNAKKLLQIVLVGQPELNTLLSQPRLRQLSQRITARFHLKPLSLEETHAYIHHRLDVAGMPSDRNPFTPRAIKRIHHFTGGIPRRINVLCERLLIGAYGHNKPKIDNQILKLAESEVIDNLGEPKPSTPPTTWIIAAGVGAVSVTLTAFFMWLYASTGNPAPVAQAVQAAPATATAPTTAPTTTPSAAPITAPQPESQKSTPVIAEANNIAITSPAAQTDHLIANALSAQTRLLEYLNIEISSDNHPCWQEDSKIQCNKVKIGSWDELREINRPAVLTLTTPDKFRAYTVLIGINATDARVLSGENDQQTTKVVALSELGPAWSGEIFYLWHPPKGFTEALIQGQRSPAITWLAQKFAELDGREKPLTNDHFSAALAKRVKIFQRNNGLTPDGIVGEQTLLKLNEKLGIDTPLQPVYAN